MQPGRVDPNLDEDGSRLVLDWQVRHLRGLQRQQTSGERNTGLWMHGGILIGEQGQKTNNNDGVVIENNPTGVGSEYTNFIH